MENIIKLLTVSSNIIEDITTENKITMTIKHLNDVIDNFNKVINNHKTYQSIGLLISLIIAFDKFKGYIGCNTETLNELRKSVHKFNTVITNYFTDFEKDLNDLIVERSEKKEPSFEDMSKEELLKYIKDKGI